MPDPRVPDLAFLRYGQLGTEFVVIILGGAYAGHLLDERQGGSGLFLLIGVSLGFALGLWRLVRLAARINGPGAKD